MACGGGGRGQRIFSITRRGYGKCIIPKKKKKKIVCDTDRKERRKKASFSSSFGLGGDENAKGKGSHVPFDCSSRPSFPLCPDQTRPDQIRPDVCGFAVAGGTTKLTDYDDDCARTPV